ncbi:MAG TPA: hypothetical protein VK611_25220 [Acidimicrobiales bacterium]|nr:hypothetical protein [Acidimicrobiales bacterium]
MIPRRLVRTVPAATTPEVERWWVRFRALHPDWELVTHRDPIDPGLFPFTSPYWSRCSSGAQRAGLIRLEDISLRGGVYVDSDMEPFRAFDPLLTVPMFAAWEDEHTIPDACFGAHPGHPAVEAMMQRAVREIRRGPWESGPGVFTGILPGRDDVLVLPPGAFYPDHYLRLDGLYDQPGPWVFVRHHYRGSWLNDTQRQALNRQRSDHR